MTLTLFRSGSIEGNPKLRQREREGCLHIWRFLCLFSVITASITHLPVCTHIKHIHMFFYSMFQLQSYGLEELFLCCSYSFFLISFTQIACRDLSTCNLWRVHTKAFIYFTVEINIKQNCFVPS